MPKNIWKSIKEYENDPEVLKAKLDEYKEGVKDNFTPDEMSSLSRRKFLAILAASTAYATTACTNYRDKGEIVPYVDRPEEILPGKPNFYASTFSDDGKSYGILVKTREGRPIKIEGNPDDPINKGKIPSKVHASILNLYDPERLTEPTLDGKEISWEKVNKSIANLLASSNKEIALITNPITSPATQKLLDELQAKYSNVKVYTTQLFSNCNRQDAWKKSYDSEVLPSIKWNKAKVIVSLESDFLGKEGNRTENARLYAEGRDIVNGNDINRLYTFEAGMSLTGMNSDYRVRLKPQKQYQLVMALLSELLKRGSISSSNFDSSILSSIRKNSISSFATDNNLDTKKLTTLVSDLGKNKGKTIIYAGDILPTETHIAVNLLNDALGNSNLYDYSKGFVNFGSVSSPNDIKQLVANMYAGSVGAVIHFDSNPVYELSNSFGYAEALTKVETVVALSEAVNETTKLSSYVLPLSNILESWGVHQTRVGSITLQQPVISTLYNTKQKEEVLLNWLGNGSDDAYTKYLKSYVKENVYNKGSNAADFNTFWFSALHDGVINVSSKINSYPNFIQSNFANANTSVNGFTVLLQDNYSFGLGQYANNGWLQELPHPVTKLTWDNCAAVSPSTAKELGVENDDVLKINIGDREISIAAMIQPGMANETIAIELGYGRSNAGTVANNVGVNANLLLDGSSQLYFDNASVTKTGETYKLVSTQEHHSLDEELVKDLHLIRNIIQEGTAEEYAKHPEFLKEHKHEIFSITDNHEYNDVKWSMSIDLNKCLGCSECITSCNVENNIPVVGKDQVEVGREMHWLRLDRYYSGTPDEPIVSVQPMLCQHCDNAPCENVCPVNATNHSPDGLNQMVYNRCVGTRYCANNCPYKVRRFNFYDFRDHFRDEYYQNELTYLVNNPEVTVRSRGVIEKCTFCVQNIMEGRELAIKEDEEFTGKDVTTSCQTACPTNAIEFGNSNIPESTIAKNREHNLSYHVLEELNIIPNVTYLAKIRNTHSEDV
ncbi:MAG: TAT-variant-translocated molybdopterin oxidoreductase [Melioribacteraceae bacterium]